VFLFTEEHEQFTTLARHRTQVTKKLRQTKSHIKSMLLFHGIKVPDEFDNSNWTIAIMVRRNKIQHFLWRFSLEKIRMFKFIKSEYLEIANQMRLL
jgi:hypothetical protein